MTTERKNNSRINGTSPNDSATRAFAGRTTPRFDAARLRDCLAFMRCFVSRPLEIASVVPSSTFLEERLVKVAETERAACVVELGPGTGGTTRALLRTMMPQARLLAIELNPAFCMRLRREIADPRLTVQAGSAEDLIAYLERWRLPPPDVVISGIPFSTLPAAAARRIATAVDASLAPGGRMVAYQVRPHVAHYIAPHLGAAHMAWEWRNLPPMRVFRWLKPAACG